MSPRTYTLLPSTVPSLVTNFIGLLARETGSLKADRSSSKLAENAAHCAALTLRATAVLVALATNSVVNILARSITNHSAGEKQWSVQPSLMYVLRKLRRGYNLPRD
jgi:hypothetical protein